MLSWTSSLEDIPPSAVSKPSCGESHLEKGSSIERDKVGGNAVFFCYIRAFKPQHLSVNFQKEFTTRFPVWLLKTTAGYVERCNPVFSIRILVNGGLCTVVPENSILFSTRGKFYHCL